MYTVLIVEDELLVRIGIASSVPWAQLDMRVIAEEADGISAWESFQRFRPDIVIADIRMPRMDGLELLRRIRQMDSECALILVTNVEGEDVLNQARELKTSSLLLKAAMKRDDITAAVVKARDSLTGERGGYAFSPDENQLWKDYLGLKTAAAPFNPQGFVLMRLLPSPQSSFRLTQSLINLFEYRIRNLGKFCVVALDNGAVALASEPFDQSHGETLLCNLARYILGNFGEESLFVVSPESCDVNEIRSQLRRASGYTEQAVFFDRSVLLIDKTGTPLLEPLDQAIAFLSNAMILMDKPDKIADCIRDMKKLPPSIRESWSQGVALGEKILLSLNAQPAFENLYQMVEQIRCAAKDQNHQIRAAVRPEILAAVDYISNHLDDKLSVQYVSQIAGYNTAYFSSLFKRELGISYSDFITRSRMNKAKALICQSDLPLQEIAAICGFDDFSYFSTRFKKVVGMTPSQWRKQP